MNHWILDSVAERRVTALKTADRIQIHQQLLHTGGAFDATLDATFDIAPLRDVAAMLELAALDLILDRFEEDDDKLKLMRECAADAFRLLRVLPQTANPISNAIALLRMSALAVLGDKGSDAARLLRQQAWPLPLESPNWGQRTWAGIIDVWLRLFRKKGWEDRDCVLASVERLRDAQSEFEAKYLGELAPAHAKHAALELIGLYHLAKAAEIFALFITDGVVDGNYQVRQLLDTHFDRVLAVCDVTPMLELEPLTRLLAAASAQMVENSIWTVTRAVNGPPVELGGGG